MATNLAIRPSNVPLPTGVNDRRRHASEVGAVAWPGAENWLLVAPGVGGEVGPFNRPERFWLKAGASIIAGVYAGGWTRYDYQLRLVVNGSYGNDLNGINLFQKANSGEMHTNYWQGISIEGLWYCEANTNYIVYLLSKGYGTNTYYWQGFNHYNLWAYTIGEGVY